MAQTDAYSIFKANGTDEAPLREVIASIQDQIDKTLVSGQVKNTNLSGDPLAGSVKVSRLMSATVRNYGTARGNDFTGDKVKDNYVVVNLDQRKEIVEEVNKFDVAQYGLADMLGRRASSIASSFQSHLDAAYFAMLESEGTEVTVEGSSIQDKIEFLIQKAETTVNSNVRGVNRSMLALTVTPEVFGLLENYIDSLPNPKDGGVDVNYFHRVRIYSNLNQTEDVIVQLVGAGAQPVAIIDIDMQPVPMSAEMAVTFFFNYGVKAVTPDLVYYGSVTEAEVSA
jgi:hypothetical protein